MRRVPLLLVGAVVVAVLGVAGLLRGAVPERAVPSSHEMDMGAPTSATGPAGASAGIGGPMEVTKAYVQEPASPVTAAAYFTVTNRSGQDDTLIAVSSGAAQSTQIHLGTDMTATPAGGVPIAAGHALALSVGHGHVMMEQLIGTLRPGQSVTLQLQFQHAPPVLVAAPVIAIGAPVPG